MKAVASALLLAISTGNARAECKHYPEDGSPPPAKTCYQGMCESTTMVEECNERDDFRVRFANGFEVADHTDKTTGRVTTSLTKDGKPMDATKFCWVDEQFGYGNC